MMPSRMATVFLAVVVLFVAEAIVGSNAFPAPSNEEVEGGSDGVDIETMVQEMRENEKINPLTMTPVARKLWLMKLQREVKRAWRQCTFNAVSCFG